MAELRYDFRVHGANVVKQQLRAVERMAMASNRRMARAAGMTGAGARQTAGRSVSSARNFHRSMAVWQEREHNRGVARSHRIAQQEIRKENAMKMRALRDRLRERQRARIREERSAAAAARVQARSRAGFVAGTVGTAGRSALGAVRGVGRYALMGAGLMGGFATGAAVRNAANVERASVGLANQAYREGSGVSRKELAAKIQARARSVGAESGLGAEGIIRGMRQFVAISGNVEASNAMAGFMADIADASGADIGDVGRTGGQIMQAMQARGLETPEAMRQTEQIMAAMAGQAKVGSIEFADLAQQMGKLVSSTATFDGEVSELATTMGAISQLAIAGAASSPEEAMTAILRFADDLAARSKTFEKSGIDVFTDKTKTKLRKPEQILADMVGATKGDLSKVGKLFGIRAKKAVMPFQTIYSEASAKAGGGEKGHTAGMKAMADLLDSVRGATMGATEIRGSAKAARQTSSRQFAIAMEQFNQSVGTELLPVLARLIPKFAELIPHLATGAKLLGRFVDHLAKNPLETIGKLIAMKVALDIAGAGIGRAVRDTVTRMMMGGAGGVGATGGAVAGAGKGGARGPAVLGLGRGAAATMGGAIAAGLTGLTIGTITAGAIETSMITGWEKDRAKQDALLGEAQRAAGSGDPKQVAAVKAKLEAEAEKQEGRLGIMQTARTLATGGDSTLGKVISGAVNPLGALFGALAPMRDVEQMTVGEQARTARSAAGQIDQRAAEANAQEWLASLNEGAKAMGLVVTGAKKASDELQKIASAGPNRSDSPTSTGS